MCLPMDDAAMVHWLHSQVRVMEAWRSELAMRPEIDIDQLEHLERHYAWLTAELARLDRPAGSARQLN